MAKCILCSKELNFMNAPSFGAGKLRDGGAVCSSCFNKINKVNPHIAFKLRKHTLDDIKNLLGHTSEKTGNNNPVGVKPKPSTTGSTIGGLVVMGLIIWGVVALFIHVSSPKPPTHSQAFIISKQFVERTLNQPKMNFPYMDYRHDEPGNGLYLIESHVDTKNAFGGDLRITYRVKMHYKGGDWAEIGNWELKDIDTWTN